MSCGGGGCPKSRFVVSNKDGSEKRVSYTRRLPPIWVVGPHREMRDGDGDGCTAAERTASVNGQRTGRRAYDVRSGCAQYPRKQSSSLRL